MAHSMLLFLLLSTVPVSLSIASVLKKTIHADGRKDFVIVKEIKQNQCTCSCTCLPHTNIHSSTTTTRKPLSTASFIHEVTKSARTWLTEEKDKHSQRTESPSTYATTAAQALITNDSNETDDPAEKSEELNDVESVSTTAVAAGTTLPKKSEITAETSSFFSVKPSDTFRTPEITESYLATEPKSTVTVKPLLSVEPISTTQFAESTKVQFGTSPEQKETERSTGREEVRSSSTEEVRDSSTAATDAGMPIVQEFSKVEEIGSTTLGKEIAIKSDERPEVTKFTRKNPPASSLMSGLKTATESATSSVSEQKATVHTTYSTSTIRKHADESNLKTHAAAPKPTFESVSEVTNGANGTGSEDREATTILTPSKLLSAEVTHDTGSSTKASETVQQESTDTIGGIEREAIATGSSRISSLQTTSGPKISAAAASLPISESGTAHAADDSAKTTNTKGLAITSHAPESTAVAKPTVTALEERIHQHRQQPKSESATIIEPTASALEERIQQTTAASQGRSFEAEQPDATQPVLPDSQSLPSVLIATTSTTREVGASSGAETEAVDHLENRSTVVFSTAQHESATRGVTVNSAEARLLPTDGDFTPNTLAEMRVTVAATSFPKITTVSGETSTKGIIPEDTEHEKSDEKEEDEQQEEETAQEQDDKEATKSSQSFGASGYNQNMTGSLKELSGATHDSLHEITEAGQKFTTIREVVEESYNRTESERKNETGNLVAASEIVPKTVKFEEKRSDVVNKTDSSDIYLNTPSPPSTAKSAPENLTATSGASISGGILKAPTTISLSEGEKSETNVTNRTLGEASEIVTGNGILLSDLEGGNFTEPANKTILLDDMRMQELNQTVESNPSIRAASQIDGTIGGVPAPDHKYDVYIRLEKPLNITAVEAAKLPDNRTTTKEGYGRQEEVAAPPPTPRILIPLQEFASTKFSKQEIGGGESFKVEEGAARRKSNAIGDGDANEQIRQGWRKALEELRQKLRSYQESLKSRSNEKMSAEISGEGENDKNKKDKAVNADDKKDGHLYIIQLGIKDLKKPLSGSLSLDNNNRTRNRTEPDENISSTGLIKKESGDHVVEKSGPAEELVASMLLNNGSNPEYPFAAGQSKELPAISAVNIGEMTTMKTSVGIEPNPGARSPIAADSAHERWKALKSEIHHERQETVAYWKLEESGTTITPSTVSGTADNKEDAVPDPEKMKKQDPLAHEKLSVDFSIDEQPGALGKEVSVQDEEIPAHQQLQNIGLFPQTLQIHLSEANSTADSERNYGGTDRIDPLELRRKMQEERNRAILREIENRKFVEEEERKRKMLLLNEGKQGNVELSNGGLINARLLEEKARLEQARLLREEQLKLEKQQELRRGLSNKAELERQEQIARQLEQLAESERRHREQLEREKLVQLARTKHYRIIPTGDSFSATRTDITTLSEANLQGASSGNSNGHLLPASQCYVIRQFVQVYQLADPGEWIRMNCEFAKTHFPRASCERIQELFESCFQKQ